MANKQPVVGIIGATITGNRGAEAMLVTTIGIVREKYPNAKFKVFSYFPNQDKALLQDPDIEILSGKPAALVFDVAPFATLESLFRIIRIRLPDSLLLPVTQALRGCDVLLDISGVSYVQGREIYLPFNILNNLPAMMLGIPVVKLAQALGPFDNPLNQLAAKIMLPHCAHIFARGSITGQQLEKLKITNVSRAADVAFSYRPEYNLTWENEDLVDLMDEKLSKYKREGKTLIAVAPSTVVYAKSKKYIEQLCQLVQSLDGERVRFFMVANSNRQSSNKKGNNDLFLLRILQDHMKANFPKETYDRLDWAIWDANTLSLRRLLRHCDLLLTSRFHAMISGMALCIPTLVIGWSHKYYETLEDFGMGHCTIDFGDTGTDLSDMAHQLLQNNEEIHCKIAASLSQVKESSRRQFDILEKLLS